MKSWTSVFDVVGLGTVAAGLALAWLPLGIIAAGAGLLVLSWRASS